jgi:hypothetical protein
MTGVISAAGLTIAGGPIFNADSPIIGYDNVVTAANTSATTEDTAYPADNLANPATHLIWKAGAGSPTSPEYLTCSVGNIGLQDYLAIAHHNFGTAGAALTVEGKRTSGDSWTALVGPTTPTDDGPIIFRWNADSYFGLRLKIGESTVAGVVPFCAVMYIGQLLMLQRRIYVGHSPITYNRKTNVASQRSVSGNFLGRIVLGQKNSSTITINNMTPAWFRASLWPFLLAAEEIPFFFAWRPTTYLGEAGYVWLIGDVSPSNSHSNGFMSVSLSVEGVV